MAVKLARIGVLLPVRGSLAAVPGEGAVLQVVCADAGTQLVLHPPIDPYGDGYILRFRAELLAPGLAADRWVTVANDHSLAAFFDHLVAGWHGWEGELVREALEHDMAIAATHDGIGHVRLRVTLRQGYRSDCWMASATFSLDAGEELQTLATRATEFLAV